MIDIFGRPQNVLVVGGSSEIALQIIKQLNKTNRIVKLYLAGRNLIRLKQLSSDFQSEYTKVEIIHSDHDESNSELIERIKNIEIDVAIMASGYLPKSVDQFDPQDAIRTINRNYLSIVEIGSVLLEKFKSQSFGVLVLFSSVAAMRPRPDNFLYGSAKAGLDNWARGAMYGLRGSGSKILLVRTGMVKTRMSKHLPHAPMTVDAQTVAKEITKNIKGKQQLIWIPKKIKFLVFILKLLPDSLLIKLTN